MKMNMNACLATYTVNYSAKKILASARFVKLAGMEAVKHDIIEGMCYADVIEKYDDFGLCDAAAIDCAMELGWNMKEYIDEEIMELLYSYFIYDGETTASLDQLITNEALDYISEHIDAAQKFL